LKTKNGPRLAGRLRITGKSASGVRQALDFLFQTELLFLHVGDMKVIRTGAALGKFNPVRKVFVLTAKFCNMRTYGHINSSCFGESIFSAPQLKAPVTKNRCEVSPQLPVSAKCLNAA
jgi:hypothetical protein